MAGPFAASGWATGIVFFYKYLSYVDKNKYTWYKYHKKLNKDKQNVQEKIRRFVKGESIPRKRRETSRGGVKPPVGSQAEGQRKQA